jgi:hypothetical protein
MKLLELTLRAQKDEKKTRGAGNLTFTWFFCRMDQQQ